MRISRNWYITRDRYKYIDPVKLYVNCSHWQKSVWAAIIWIISVEVVELELSLERWVGFSAKRRRKIKEEGTYSRWNNV